MSNVLFVTVDSLRADHVGSYGYERDTTPFVDELSTSGHTFSNAFAHAGATRVSFPSILTSSSPLMFGGVDSLASDRTSIAELLHRGGYRTAGFHSNLFLSSDFGYDRGFDTFYDSKTDPSWSARLRQLVKQNLDQDGKLFGFLKRAFEATEKHAGVEIGSAYVTADELTDKAIDWLSSVDPSESWFLWVHYMDVHHPYVPPAEHQRAFRDSPIDDREAVSLRRKMLESPSAITEDEYDRLIDLYDAEIRFTDAEIERLVETARSDENDTLVVFTADHGEEFRDHGQFSHNTVHDEGIHVPLVIHDGEGSGRYEQIVGLMDIPPTIAEYADQPMDENFYGHSLWDLIEGEEWNRSFVIGEWGEFGTDDHNFFYRDDSWKYVREGDEQLYDISADPNERTDVSAEHPDVVDRIRSILDEHEEEIKRTHQDLDTVEMNEDVRERLHMLGYTDE